MVGFSLMFLNFKVFGKTILAVKRKVGLFWAMRFPLFPLKPKTPCTFKKDTHVCLNMFQQDWLNSVAERDLCQGKLKFQKTEEDRAAFGILNCWTVVHPTFWTELCRVCSPFQAVVVFLDCLCMLRMALGFHVRLDVLGTAGRLVLFVPSEG